MIKPDELQMLPEYEAWINRMYNWKFKQAVAALPVNSDEFVRESTEALAEVFGDLGWVISGSMSEIIRLAVGGVAGYSDGGPEDFE